MELIEAGIAQSSVVGPVLYMLYTEDIVATIFTSTHDTAYNLLNLLKQV